VKLCEASLRNRTGGKFEVPWSWNGLGVLRQYSLIPAAARTLPLLTLLSGGDSRSVISNAVPAIFVLLLPAAVFECALPRSIRIGAEETSCINWFGRINSKLTRDEIGGLEIARGGTMAMVRLSPAVFEFELGWRRCFVRSFRWIL
jgi:hypothetical protein